MIREYRNHTPRDVLLSPRYAKHISAMTGEDLHSKAEIAEELAWRDIQIDQLQAALSATVEQRDSLLEALKESLRALQIADETRNGPINDTIWMPVGPETLFDFMDAAIAAVEQQADHIADTGKMVEAEGGN